MASSLQARVNQHDREIAAIRKLLLQGARMLVKIEAAQQRTEAAQQRTDAAQQRSDKRLDRLEAVLERFIRSQGGRNGHSKTDIR